MSCLCASVFNNVVRAKMAQYVINKDYDSWTLANFKG